MKQKNMSSFLVDDRFDRIMRDLRTFGQVVFWVSLFAEMVLLHKDHSGGGGPKSPSLLCLSYAGVARDALLGWTTL